MLKPQYNINSHNSTETNYQGGLLPQRNQAGSFYFETSCRSNLSNFFLSSENRRVLKKTDTFSCSTTPIKNFNYTPEIQKTIATWIRSLGWDFPISSVKTIFQHHIFNLIYTWTTIDGSIAAYSVCYFSPPSSGSVQISHIAYVFYDPQYSHSYLPIRLVLQVIIDSHQQGLNFCYLGRFSPPDQGFYKRTLPGFEYFHQGNWQKYNHCS
ncbi:MAG: hypothetical protein WC686_02640 [Candidatus Shapirobacteria bacterium]|jgi:hypothetical protein